MLGPSQQVLVLIDVSGIEDLEEMTPRLLHYGMGLQDADTWRVVVEAVQGCSMLSADPDLVRASLLERVAQVQQEPETDIGAIMMESPQLLPHATALRRAFGVPVYDSLQALQCCIEARSTTATTPEARPEVALVEPVTARAAAVSTVVALPKVPPAAEAAVLPPDRQPSEALRRVLAREASPPNPWAELMAHSTKVVVGPGDLLRIPFFVGGPTCLEYSFEAQGGLDIGFSVVGGAANAAAVATDTGQPPLLSTRGGSKTQQGEVTLSAGWACATFDNTYSWVRSKGIAYSLICTPATLKQRFDEALAAFHAAAAQLEQRQKEAIVHADEYRAVAGREAEAHRWQQQRQRQQQALRDMRAEYAAQAGEDGTVLATMAATALSEATAQLSAVTEERTAAAARYEEGRAERELQLLSLERMLEQLRDTRAEEPEAVGE